MTLVGAGMAMSPFHGTTHAAQNPHEGLLAQAEDPSEKLLAQAKAQPDQKQTVKSLDSLGWIVVTADGPKKGGLFGGGQFGRHTPGTATSGLQEAFNEAKKTGQDVYICGGGGPRYVWYVTKETLRIPWMQNWHCDGGEYFIGYQRPTGDAVVIDSMMSTKIKLGGIATESTDGAVVHIAPGQGAPGGPDNFAGIGGTKLDFNALVGSGKVIDPDLKAGAEGQKKSVALWLDASKGPIISCWIFSNELNAADKGLLMTGTQSITHNKIEFASHLTNTAIEIGDSKTGGTGISDNRIEAWIQGLPWSTGARIRGERNYFFLTTEQHAPGKDIIFEADAKNNLVIAQNLPDGITNNATTSTNRIISTRSIGFDLPTPSCPASGEDCMNRNPYPADVIIRKPGTVSAWTLTDANGKSETFAAGLFAGQRFGLEPGDKIRFTYTAALSWKWKALS